MAENDIQSVDGLAWFSTMAQTRLHYRAGFNPKGSRGRCVRIEFQLGLDTMAIELFPDEAEKFAAGLSAQIEEALIELRGKK